MAKTIDGVIGYVGTEASNYIKQINDGTKTHDIAVQNGIKFFNGGTEIDWDGKQAVEVVIPTLSDIVANPVVFAGTVGDNGVITWVDGYSGDPEKGYLVYIQKNCTFGGQTCEPGDMAVWDGKTWQVIQGENQVSLKASALALGKTAQSAITVEGQTLTLAVDYNDVRENTKVRKNTSTTIDVLGAGVSVAAMNIALTQAEGSTYDISTAVGIDLPTKLANGAVTIDSVLEASNFTFTSGSFPTISKNGAAVSASVSHNMSIGKANAEDGANGDYLTNVVAIKGVSVVDAAVGDSGAFGFVSGLAAATGKSFISDIHTWTATDADKPADITVPGAVSAVASKNTFVNGFSAAAGDSGDIVSSITVGAVTIASGEGILTGVSTSGSDFVSSVTFGTAISDNKNQWFYNGLGEEGVSGDVVTSVAFGTTKLVSDSTYAASAMVSATVSGHVLSFSTGSFMTPVNISVSGQEVKKKSFTKSGVSLSGFSYASKGFTTGSLSQAATSVSFKNVLTGAVTLTQGADTKYYLDKEESNAYTPLMSYKKLTTTDATFTKNSPALQNTTITATIPSNTFAVSLEGGSLPTFAVGAPTGKITGTVGTELTTVPKEWLGVDPKKKDIPVAGAYTLTSDASVAGIAVASAGEYDVKAGTVTIAADSFVTDVLVDGTAVGVSSNA